MSRVAISPATADDFREIVGREPPVRVFALAGRLDGKLLGVGGIAFSPDGSRLAFCELTDEARKHPVSLHRAALMTMEMAKGMKIKRLIAEAQDNNGAAVRWLLRLGFAPATPGDDRVFVHALES